MGRDTKVRFVKEIIFDGDYFPEYGYKSVATDKSKRYRNVLSRLLKLSKAENDLLNYLVDFMDTKNVVYSNGQFKDRFNKLLFSSYKEDYLSEGLSEEDATREANKKKYSDITIRKAYSKLNGYGLLIPYMDDSGKTLRGCYWVNPEFFWKDSEKEREKAIRKILQIEAGTHKTLIKAYPNSKQ